MAPAGEKAVTFEAQCSKEKQERANVCSTDKAQLKRVNSEAKSSNSEPEKKLTKAQAAMMPQVASKAAFANEKLREAAYYSDDNVLIFNMDVREALGHLEEAGIIVNCIVTSPPFYG